MTKVTDTLGIHIEKNMLQFHGVSSNGYTVLKRRVMRDELLAIIVHIDPCAVVLEACIGAFCCGRKFEALSYQVKLLSPLTNSA